MRRHDPPHLSPPCQLYPGVYPDDTTGLSLWALPAAAAASQTGVGRQGQEAAASGAWQAAAVPVVQRSRPLAPAALAICESLAAGCARPGLPQTQRQSGCQGSLALESALHII